MVLGRRNITLALVFIVCTAFVIQWDVIPQYHLKVIEKRVEKHFKHFNGHLDMKTSQHDTSIYGIGVSMLIKDDKDSILGTLHYRQANACNFGGCNAIKCDSIPKEGGFKEHIYYYAITESDTIRRMGVLEYESTYGYEIVSSAWLKQFYKDSIGSFELNKNIDGITGATVSVNAMINDVNSLDR